MKICTRIFHAMLSLMLLFLLTGCQLSSGASSSGSALSSAVPDDFILGMDASCVPALERSGVTYYDFDGQQQDVFKTLSQSGINYIRVRIWNNPYDSGGNGYGGGNCDLQNALLIGKRATAYGMKLFVDFHYSDFWADPGKQQAPVSWQNMDIATKTQALYLYTWESLQLLKHNGVDVGMVQIGNETNGALCGETEWESICALMNAGSRAVREVFPDAQVVLHFTNPEKDGLYRYYADQLKTYAVDYDVFASSYYPYWHGSLENLAKVLSEISQTYHKKVMVAETSYAYTSQDSDFFANTITDSSQVAKPYDYSIDGQSTAIRNVIQTVAGITDGIGVFYWEGTWISVGRNTQAENRQLWQQYGTGWASSFAGAYDPQDAGKWYGGCAVDNQALFDPDGHPLSSLHIFFELRGH